ncbi:Carbohydrate binding domain protein [Methanolobus psychrophilus R15]|nr:Carbohydrate binding domain protein [Methanolobus psychrophilus R15]
MFKTIRYILPILFFTIAILISVASASHLGNDLIPNYGFEDWSSGKPLNWTTPHADWDIVQVGGEKGNYALMLETDRYTSPGKGTMESVTVEVEEGDMFLVTAWARSINARETKAMVRGYDDERKRWITLKTFNPSSQMQHAFITVPEDITLLCMRIEAGYVDDKDKGTARSYFDELRIIDPAVENAEFYLDEGTINKNETLTIGSYELSLEEAKDNKALIKVSSAGKVIDSGVLTPGKSVEFKRNNDKYLVFWVDDVFVNPEYSEARLSQLLAGRVASNVPTIRPVDEKGLVLYLPLDENANLEAYDYSRESNHGVIYGAEWAKGMENYALRFDGVTDYLEIPNTGNKFEEGDHTFALWLRSTGLRDSTKYVICHYNWRIVWQSDSKIGFTIGRMDNKDGPAYTITADVSEIKEDWIHLTGVYKPSENKALFYVNGELAGEKDFGNERIWADYGNHNLLIGTSKHGAATFYEGLVDEVRVYDRALTPQEIRELMSKPLGLSGVSSYQSSMSLEKGMTSPVGNGFQIQYSDAPYLNLALTDGEQTQRYSLVNISEGQTLFLKNSQGVAAVRLNIDSITSERLNLSDIWVANEKANVPVLKVTSIDFSQIRAYAPATVRVTVVNSGSKAYPADGDGTIDLYLGDEKVGSYRISESLAPGETLEHSFELNSKKAGDNELRAIVSSKYGTESSTSTVKIEPPVNPPLSGIPLYVKETGSGITLHMTLNGPGIKGESWKDNAQVSIRIMEPLGPRTFYDKSHSISGAGKTIEIPYEEFYQGDEQYLITVKFREAENSVVAKIAGEDGIYNPPNKSYLLLLLLVPVTTYAVRRKFFGGKDTGKKQSDE